MGYLFSGERDGSIDCKELILPSSDDNTKADRRVKQLHLPLELGEPNPTQRSLVRVSVAGN